MDGDAAIGGEIAFDEHGLVPCVVQDWTTGEVLTVAYMNREALERTVESGQTHFWSRSRGELWHKGETSGNVQRVRSLRYDCDGERAESECDRAAVHHHAGTGPIDGFRGGPVLGRARGR